MLLRIICGCCARLFELCRSCYRGQLYCGEECAISAARESHREAQRRYRQTDNGKAMHRMHEKQRRMRDKIKRPVVKAIKRCGCLMMRMVKGDIFARQGNCLHCGISGHIVDRFPRRC